MRDALESLPGVSNVTVDYSKKEASATIDGSKVQPADLLSALEKADFGGKIQ